MLSKRLTKLTLLACLLSLPGCSRSSNQSTNEESQSGLSQKQLLIGNWSTTTSSEMAQTAWNLKFLESGEYQVSGPLSLGSETVVVEVNGKQEIARFIGSGTWELNGDELQVVINTSNLQDFSSEPMTSKVLEINRNKLALQENDATRVYFRLQD